MTNVATTSISIKSAATEEEEERGGVGTCARQAFVDVEIGISLSLLSPLEVCPAGDWNWCWRVGEVAGLVD